MNNTKMYGIPVTKQVGDIERLLRAMSAMRNALDEFIPTLYNSDIELTNVQTPGDIYNTLEYNVMNLIALIVKNTEYN